MSLEVEVKACSDCPFYQNLEDMGCGVSCVHPSYRAPYADSHPTDIHVDHGEPPPRHCPGFMPIRIKVLR